VQGGIWPNSSRPSVARKSPECATCKTGFPGNCINLAAGLVVDHCHAAIGAILENKFTHRDRWCIRLADGGPGAASHRDNAD
jgi:hypothetical protein